MTALEEEKKSTDSVSSSDRCNGEDENDDLLVDKNLIDYDDDFHKPVMHPVDVDMLAERCLRLLKHSKSKDEKISRCGEFNQFNQAFVGIGGTPGSGYVRVCM